MREKESLVTTPAFPLVFTPRASPTEATGSLVRHKERCAMTEDRNTGLYMAVAALVFAFAVQIAVFVHAAGWL